MIEASKVTAKAALLQRDSEIAADLYHRADVIAEQIGVELEPYIKTLGEPMCGVGRWEYDYLENGWVWLKHTCNPSHNNVITKIKLIELLQRAPV